MEVLGCAWALYNQAVTMLRLRSPYTCDTPSLSLWLTQNAAFLVEVLSISSLSSLPSRWRLLSPAVGRVGLRTFSSKNSVACESVDLAYVLTALIASSARRREERNTSADFLTIPVRVLTRALRSRRAPTIIVEPSARFLVTSAAVAHASFCEGVRGSTRREGVAVGRLWSSWLSGLAAAEAPPSRNRGFTTLEILGRLAAGLQPSTDMQSATERTDGRVAVLEAWAASMLPMAFERELRDAPRVDLASLPRQAACPDSRSSPARASTFGSSTAVALCAATEAALSAATLAEAASTATALAAAVLAAAAALVAAIFPAASLVARGLKPARRDDNESTAAEAFPEAARALWEGTAPEPQPPKQGREASEGTAGRLLRRVGVGRPVVARVLGSFPFELTNPSVRRFVEVGGAMGSSSASSIASRISGAGTTEDVSVPPVSAPAASAAAAARREAAWADTAV